MTFYVNLDNIKVVDNLSIFAVLKFSWFYPIRFGSYKILKFAVRILRYAVQFWDFV